MKMNVMEELVDFLKGDALALNFLYTRLSDYSGNNALILELKQKLMLEVSKFDLSEELLNEINTLAGKNKLICSERNQQANEEYQKKRQVHL